MAFSEVAPSTGLVPKGLSELHLPSIESCSLSRSICPNTRQEKDIDMSYSSKGVKAGQTGQLTRVMMNGNSLYFSSIFHTFLHLLDNG